MSAIEFVNYDHHYRLTTEEVEEAVRALEPGVIQSLAVFVNGRWWPAKQPFVAAASRKGGNIKSNTDVNSRTALRHLSRLGFPTHDLTQGPLPATPSGPSSVISHDDRQLALSLAVQLLSGQTSSADEVTQVADQFAEWLGDSRQ